MAKLPGGGVPFGATQEPSFLQNALVGTICAPAGVRLKQRCSCICHGKPLALTSGMHVGWPSCLWRHASPSFLQRALTGTICAHARCIWAALCRLQLCKPRREVLGSGCSVAGHGGVLL